MSQVPKEILKQVRMIEIKTRKLVNNLMAGEYHTMFRGRGMTFAEFREYVPGDDIRSISWNVTARQGKPFIKKYDEERELTLMLAVDISGSGDIGSHNMIKGEVMAMIAAVLGFSAVKNNDQVGLILFSDRVEHFVPPKKGRAHILRILRDLLSFVPKGRGTNISVATDYIAGFLKKKSSVFIMSDFMSSDFQASLRTLGRKHDCVAVIVQDEFDLKPPKLGLVDFEDAETGETVTVDTSSPMFQSIYARNVKTMKAQRETELKRAQVDTIEIAVGPKYYEPLVRYFGSR